MKECKICKETLPFEAFKARSDKKHKRDDDPAKYSSYCKPCDSLSTKLRFSISPKLSTMTYL